MIRTAHSLAVALLTVLPAWAGASAEAQWGEVPREELFSGHFAEAPYAEAVVLLDQAIARVDEKDRLKYTRHHRTKIFSEDAMDRGIVRIPYGPDEEIKNFRAQTIIPPGHLVDVGKDHRRVEKLPGGGEVLVVEFPSLQPGVVIEYEYELRRDELHTIPVWSFRSRDFTRSSSFSLMIPPGMTYDATFPWVPKLTPRPEIRMINDPENPRREVQQITWAVTNQPAVSPVPMAGDPEQYRLSLYVQLGEFRSTYKNFQVARSWGEVGAEVAELHEAFARNDAGVRNWVEAAGITGDARTVASGLYRLVRDGIRSDLSGPDVATSTMKQVVEQKRGTPAAKSVLLAHLLQESGIDAHAVLIRRASHGPLQPKYHGVAQFNHVVVRAQIDGQMTWLDATKSGCPFGLLPPDAQVASGLRIDSDGGSELVDLTITSVTCGRDLLTEATFDKNGTLHATCRVRYEGWVALAPRAEALGDSGRQLAEDLIRTRFGAAATLKSFTLDSLESADQPLTLTISFSVPDYAHASGKELRLKLPFVSAMAENPLPDEERELPVRLGFAGTCHEELKLTMPEGWALPSAPSRGSARSSDLRYRVAHKLEDDALTSSRTVKVIEPVVAWNDAATLHGVFDKMVATDTSELVLQRQATRSSSAR